MKVLHSQDKKAAESLMQTLATTMSAVSAEALAAKFDSIAQRRDHLAHASDIVELDECVEAARISFAESKRLVTTLADEHKIISNYAASRPYLKAVSAPLPLLKYFLEVHSRRKLEVFIQACMIDEGSLHQMW